MKGSTLIKRIIWITIVYIVIKYLIKYGLWAFERGGEEVDFFIITFLMLDVIKAIITFSYYEDEDMPWHFWLSILTPVGYFCIVVIPKLWKRILELADKYLTEE